ncbi:hypothetical protein ZIOFF_009441 [Zingiber officinale]|uniref:P-type ATPase A domain-containing protein n=1 Tax=Zingiber officinale TaxID=94328 RepID=A0A8J5LWJ1_ZINOF|nr:hypothetical protein ZIOFF_009441 [Zingiber officinale]
MSESKGKSLYFQKGMEEEILRDGRWRDPLKIDQSALTRELLPVTKDSEDGVNSSSTCKQGEIEAVVIATAVHTFFGKAAHLVDSTNQHQAYCPRIDNLLVLLNGGIPIGTITKRMTAIEEMAGMGVLWRDKTGTLTLNKLSVDKNLIEVFSKVILNLAHNKSEIEQRVHAIIDKIAEHGVRSLAAAY